MGERESLVARIRHIRSVAAAAANPAKPHAVDPQHDELAALEIRVAHVEQLVEGLQDSVHRESLRYDKLLAELEARIQPAAMGAALDEDARNRGLS
jgi:uncharacterized coiled-coil protein SlyX